VDLNQISITVRNLAEGLAFYQKLGLKLIVQDETTRYARFELPSGPATLSLYENAQAGPSSATLYFEVDDVDHRHAELRAAGVSFDGPPTDQDWLWREAHFADPSGNRLCLFHAGANRRFPPWRLPA
jgi:catechol 2,3-dioxygenase-like lactoylglutathione lyase family enzyme